MQQAITEMSHACPKHEFEHLVLAQTWGLSRISSSEWLLCHDIEREDDCFNTSLAEICELWSRTRRNHYQEMIIIKLHILVVSTKGTKSVPKVSEIERECGVWNNGFETSKTFREQPLKLGVKSDREKVLYSANESKRGERVRVRILPESKVIMKNTTNLAFPKSLFR